MAIHTTELIKVIDANRERFENPDLITLIGELISYREEIRQKASDPARLKFKGGKADLLESRHINTQSGILDPKTFEVKPHSFKYLTTTKLPFGINHNARNLKLWNHVLTIIDPKDINLLMELIWICISGNNPFKKMFVFKGISNTQKSTLADIIVWIIGNENVSRQKPEAFLSKNSIKTGKLQ